MRVLTSREKDAFETAWMFMERVGGMCERNGEDERLACNLIIIRKDNTTSSLPSKVKAAIFKMGGLRAVNEFFNGMRKEENFPKFVSAIMLKREQPRDYWAEGTLYYDSELYGSNNVKIVEYESGNSSK